MGVLQSVSGDNNTLIPPRLLVGRSPSCGLRLSDPHVSSEHAIIVWSGKYWELRDLGSSNGTFVDGGRIEIGFRVRLSNGSRIAFGDRDAQWTVVDDGPPGVMAVHQPTGLIQGGTHDLLVLPNADQPEISIYTDVDGQWRADGSGQDVRPLEDQDTIATSVGDWTVLLPMVPERTPLLETRMPFESIALRFQVARNEESVAITIVGPGIEKSLPEREHGYVLLTLARARREDENLPIDQRGWRDRDELQRMLAIDTNGLNVAIHRARQQMSAAGVQRAARLVEVRTRERRLGTDRIQIARR